jgi:protocatechuate 3,4-dioxygenase beta subunit
MLLLFSGLMHQLQTVMFFAEAPGDPVYAAVPPARRALLVAKQQAPGRYCFDIRLRGEGETPFFDA